jgi:hypothetical protein
MVRWICAVLVAYTCTLPFYAVFAAPDRLNDEVPDAVPDPEGTWSFGYGYQGIGLDGPLTDSDSTHSQFKLRYTFSPDAAGSVYYRQHSLSGNVGVVNPVFDNQDEATAYGFDLRLNLLNEASRYEKADDPKSFVAGSAFDAGVSLERLLLNAGTLDQSDMLLRAYLAYSTDLSEQLRAHTFFSTGRISGDTHTGSVNRIGAGLDYQLSDGEHPLTLMADAVLDLYNFRQPTFNTSRITSFDVGLRYGINENLFASLGWMTYNDSENDASGSGLFAGLQWLTDSGAYCEPTDEEAPAGDFIVEPDPASAIPPVETAAAAAPEVPPTPAAEAPSPPAAAAAPTPAVPAEESPDAATPPPADVASESEPDTVVLPDARADLPVRQRVVSSLQEEFSAEQEGAPAGEIHNYDPQSWEDSSAPTAEPLDEIELDEHIWPELDLFPEKMQADAGDVRPDLRRGRFEHKTPAAAQEQPLPSDDLSVVEIAVVSETDVPVGE